MLARLHGHDGRLRMPMIRHRDDDGIYIFGIQEFTDILIAGGPRSGQLEHLVPGPLQGMEVTVAQGGHAAQGHLRKAGGQGESTGIDADHAHPDTVA